MSIFHYKENNISVILCIYIKKKSFLIKCLFLCLYAFIGIHVKIMTSKMNKG